MDGIEKITNRITSDINAEIAVLEKETQDKISEIKDHYENEARSIEAVAAKKRDITYKAHLDRLHGSADMEKRQLLLSAKQSILNEIFEDAKKNLLNMSEEDYVNYLVSTIIQNGVGNEEIILCKKDAALCQTIVDKANMQKSGANFVCSQETRDFDGGVILKSGFVEINCSFNSQLHALRQDMGTEIAKILFD